MLTLSCSNSAHTSIEIFDHKPVFTFIHGLEMKEKSKKELGQSYTWGDSTMPYVRDKHSAQQYLFLVAKESYSYLSSVLCHCS